MALSKKIQESAESWSETWKDRLRGWLGRSIAEGITKMLDDMEPTIRGKIKPGLIKFRDNPNTPAETKALINDMLEGGGAWHLPLLIVGGIIFLLPMLLGLLPPVARLMEYGQERLFHSGRFDPATIGRLWLRDKPTYEWAIDDLRDLGFTEQRINAIKELTKFLPGPLDLVNWLAKEVFEPEMIARYGLDDEYPTEQLELFAKQGVEPDQVRNFWRAHWIHPGLETVFNLLHRAQVTPDEVWNYYRVVEIPPYWRDKLTEISWDTPNRVETRMMCRYLDMPKADVMELLKFAGLHERYRSDAADFMIIMGVEGDLRTRYRNGWITKEDIERELLEKGVSEAIATRVYQRIVKEEQPAQVAVERELTKTEIIKGVKMELISWDDGIDLLMDMGYSADTADFILAINIAVATGSPETMPEYKELTQKYRKSLGQSSKEVSPALKAAALEVVRLTGEVKSLDEAVTKEKATLLDTEILPEEATKRLKELEVTRNRARAELARVNTDYKALLAEFRHKAA